MINDVVNELISYAKIHLGMKDFDSLYFKNVVLGELGLKFPSINPVDEDKIKNMKTPDYFVDEMESYLVNSRSFSVKEAELEAIKIMGLISPNPSVVVDKYNEIKKESTRRAVDYLYDLSIKNYYIAKTKIDKNIVWDTDWNSKNLEISINLSKPEKNNKDIAKLISKEANLEEKYPKCLLCLENLGFYGNDKQPARENIRVIPMNLAGDEWYLQYSPYGYYYMHCICFSKYHKNMTIERKTFQRLLDFVDQVPCFFIGSNADLPIVGGSILNHEHFQGGEHILPVMRCKPLKEYGMKKYHDSKLYKLDWYNSCILIESKNKEELINLSTEILDGWRKYTDLDNDIVCFDDKGRHNTITPSVRKVNDTYYMYLILRNNRCNDMYPDGIFHAHKEYHHIKKEGIGIIEAMGLFILPARLVRQSNEIKDVLEKNFNDNSILEKYPDLEDFLPMIHELSNDYNPSTVDKNIKEYINTTCKNILINTGVFKDDTKGNAGFDKFIGGLNL
ncbi:MAG: galactose-1-phosphate uridylyltransferase [Bacilli bacterium]